MFVLVVSPGFSLVQTMMTTDNTVTNPLVEASLRDGLITELASKKLTPIYVHDVVAVFFLCGPINNMNGSNTNYLHCTFRLL